MNKTLYDLLDMKAKNSIFKSVLVTDKNTMEGFPIVEVEPYDQTFLNAIAYPKKYNETIDRIIKKVWEYMDGQETWLAIYTDYGQIEILLSNFYMREIFGSAN